MTFRGIIFVSLLVVLIGSIAVRAATDTSSSSGPSSSAQSALAESASKSSAHGFVGGTTGSTSSDTITPTSTSGTDSKDSMLPYLTEGSFFGILGFALGYTSRKIVKLFLILIALVFAAIQGLSFAGVAEVDWGKAMTAANDLIFNVNQHQSWLEFMKAKLPSAGAFGGGFLLGFKRG